MAADGQFAFEALKECTDLQAFGTRMLEVILNAALSEQADEVCNAEYGSKDPRASKLS